MKFHALILGALASKQTVSGSSTRFLRLQEADILFSRELAPPGPSPTTFPDNCATPYTIGPSNRQSTVCLDERTGCNANDLRYLNCSLVPVGNICFPECDNGTCGFAKVKLQCYVRNGSNSARTVTWVVAQLDSNPVDDCAVFDSCRVGFCASGVTLPQGVPQLIEFPTEFNYTCGTDLQFAPKNTTAEFPDRLILGSGSTSDTTCTNVDTFKFDACFNSFSSKCSYPTDTVPIFGPLIFPQPKSYCTGTLVNLIPQIQIKFRILGGTSPYFVRIKCNGVFRDNVATNTIGPAPSTGKNGTSASDSFFRFPLAGNYTYTGDQCPTGFFIEMKDSVHDECPPKNRTVDGNCCADNPTCNTAPQVVALNGCDASVVTPFASEGLTWENIFTNNAGACTPVAGYQLTAHDDPTYPNTCTPNVGTLKAVVVRTYKARRLSDGVITGSCTKTFTVTDNQAPTLSVAPFNAECVGRLYGSYPTAPVFTTSDNCASLTPTLISNVSIVAWGANTCVGAEKIVEQRSETYQVSDGCLTAQASRLLTLRDTTDPVLPASCNGGDAQLTCSNLAVPQSSTCTAVDACQGDITVNAAACCANGNSITRNWIFADKCGNDVTKTTTWTFGNGGCTPPN